MAKPFRIGRISMLSEPAFETKKVFVNRTMELAKLHTALNTASSGKGRIVLIEGEAGIGKTALVERFLRDVEDARVRKAECIYGDNEPYGAIKRLMQNEEIEELRKDMPLLGLMPIPTSGRKEMKNLGDERERMFEAFTNFVKKSGKHHTSIYVLDNLQWLDEASANLLIRVLPKLEPSRILLIMLYRPEDVPSGSPLEELISEAKVLEMSTTIKLSRLGYSDVAEMIKESLNRKDIPRSFINTIHRETEGNPLFVHELLNSLIQEGILDPSSYLSIEPKNIRVPPTIKEVLLRRIAKLSPDAKKALNYAAVIGVRFDFDTLLSLTGMDEERLLDALDELLELGIIEEDKTTDEEIYVFSYVQIKEIVEETLSKSRRRVMHKKIGEFMEKHGYDPYSITEHFLSGGVYDKAYKYAIEAAEKSMEALGFEAAARYYEIASKAFEKLGGKRDEKELLDILIKLADLYKTLGRWDDAQSTYLKALRLAEKFGDDRALIDINLSMGEIENSRGKWEKADTFFEAAKNIAKRIGDKHKMGDAERALGYVHWRKGEYVDAVSHFTTAINYAKETNDSGMAGKIFIEMGNVYSDMGNIEKAIEYYHKSIPRLKKIRNYREIGRALNNLGDSHLQLGNWDKAIEYFGRCEDAAAKVGDLNMIGWSMFNAGEAYARKGDLKKAKKYCDEAYEILEKMGDRVAIAAIHRIYGMIAGKEKDWDNAVRHLEKSISMLKELNIPHLLALSVFELGRVYADKGEKEKAMEYYKEAMRLFKSIKSKSNIEKVKKAMEELK